MNWVEDQLKSAQSLKEKVVIISHIPPGHVRHSLDWTENYLDRYIQLCTTYTDLILVSVWQPGSCRLPFYPCLYSPKPWPVISVLTSSVFYVPSSFITLSLLSPFCSFFLPDVHTGSILWPSQQRIHSLLFSWCGCLGLCRYHTPGWRQLGSTWNERCS